MDSKYTLIGENRPTVPKFQVKSKPAPILFNVSSPKKVKLENGKANQENQVPKYQKSDIEQQKRLLPIYGVRNRYEMSKSLPVEYLLLRFQVIGRNPSE